MTYRSSRGSRAARRKAYKQEAIDREVHTRTRAWLAANPPRPEAPFSLGEWRDLGVHDPVYRVDFTATPRPKYPIMRVPIQARPSRWGGFGPGLMDTIDMRAVAMRMSVGATELRWWNWEPTRGMFGDAEPDIYRCVSKALAFIALVRPLLAQLPIDPWRYGVSSAREGARFFDELTEAFEQWQGRVKFRYVIPGARLGDPAETREGSSR